VADRPVEPRQAAVPTPAATVVPLRDGEHGLEVLLLRRSARGAFGGMWVFPGGQVDAADVHPPSDDGAAEEAEVAAARKAAVREAREEAALALEEGELVTLSFWLPPAEAPRRFATWFFLAPAHDHPPVVVDDHEIHEHRWQTPAAAMRSRNLGEIELVPPTFTTLWWLSHHGNVAAALAAARARPPERFMTRMAPGSDGRPRVALWDGDAGYRDGDADRPGPRRRLWMDEGSWHIEFTV
jgi:8-oxo-dGTP pyrophosphatase MutT (NUDIX family)